jgi:hypothetical protein
MAEEAAGPLRQAQARVKRCGKGAPRGWQQSWHGKPHPEQGRIGDEGLPAPRNSGNRGSTVPGRLLEAGGNAGPREMIPPRERVTELGLLRLPHCSARSSAG